MSAYWLNADPGVCPMANSAEMCGVGMVGYRSVYIAMARGVQQLLLRLTLCLNDRHASALRDKGKRAPLLDPHCRASVQITIH